MLFPYIFAGMAFVAFMVTVPMFVRRRTSADHQSRAGTQNQAGAAPAAPAGTPPANTTPPAGTPLPVVVVTPTAATVTTKRWWEFSIISGMTMLWLAVAFLLVVGGITAYQRWPSDPRSPAPAQLGGTQVPPAPVSSPAYQIDYEAWAGLAVILSILILFAIWGGKGKIRLVARILVVLVLVGVAFFGPDLSLSTYRSWRTNVQEMLRQNPIPSTITIAPNDRREVSVEHNATVTIVVSGSGEFCLATVASTAAFAQLPLASLGPNRTVFELIADPTSGSPGRRWRLRIVPSLRTYLQAMEARGEPPIVAHVTSRSGRC